MAVQPATLTAHGATADLIMWQEESSKLPAALLAVAAQP